MSWAGIIGIAAAFVATQQLGLLLAFPAYNASPMWLASGLALALVIRLGRPALIGILIGSAASNGWFFYSIGSLHPAVLFFVAANVLEPWLGAQIYHRVGRPQSHPTVRMALGLVVAGMGGALLSACLAMPATWWAGLEARTDVFMSLLYWCMGNWAGAVVVAPVGLTLIPRPPARRYLHRLPGFLAFLLATLAVLAILFSDFLIRAQIHSLSYLILVALFWGIFRRSFTELVWAQFIVAIVAVIATLNGLGPFVEESQDFSLLLLQIFLIVVPSLCLLGAAGTSERMAVDRALKRANEALEDRVVARTSELEAALGREQDLAAALAFQARHDPLTGLYNRYVFEEELNELVEKARNDDAGGGAIAYLDLDQFKVVNDTSGHAAGDELLRQLGGLIQQAVGKSTLARLGGDEFGVLMPGMDLNQARQTVDQVVEAIRRFRFDWEDHNFHVGVCAGIAAVGHWTTSAQAVMSLADAACYSAKESGRNRIKVYQPGDTEFEKMKSEVAWVERLLQLLEDDAVVLECQRIHCLDNDKSWRGEVLVRLRDPERGLVPPAEFIAIAERNDLGPDLDRKVLQATLDTLVQFRPELEHIDHLAVNLSGQSLADPAFLRFARDAVREAMIPPEKIVFEITETAAIARLSAARRFMESLGEIGCRFALDDFGSGLSSFAYLRGLPVDCLKIDGLFVRELQPDSVDYAIIEAIQHLATSLGLETVGEFVENAEVLGHLRNIGVSHAQGFYLDRPRLLEDLLVELRAGDDVQHPSKSRQGGQT